MNGPIFNIPLAQPLSDNGDIQSNCYLQFYRSETTDLEDIYADGDLSTPLANPLTANAAGRFVPIYLDPRVPYRVQLYDEDDVLLFDVDPYFPSPGLFPGQVVMYDGALDDIPAGWVVMDGTNSTIDSRDRFPVGVSNTKPLGQTGGGDGFSGNTGPAGAHDHGGNTGGHALTEAELAPHTHTMDTELFVDEIDNGPGKTYVVDGTGMVTGSTGDGDPHEHSIASQPDHTHSIDGDIQPPYFAIYFLKFTG